MHNTTATAMDDKNISHITFIHLIGFPISLKHNPKDYWIRQLLYYLCVFTQFSVFREISDLADRSLSCVKLVSLKCRGG